MPACLFSFPFHMPACIHTLISLLQASPIVHSTSTTQPHWKASKLRQTLDSLHAKRASTSSQAQWPQQTRNGRNAAYTLLIHYKWVYQFRFYLFSIPYKTIVSIGQNNRYTHFYSNSRILLWLLNILISILSFCPVGFREFPYRTVPDVGFKYFFVRSHYTGIFRSFQLLQ